LPVISRLTALIVISVLRGRTGANSRIELLRASISIRTPACAGAVAAIADDRGIFPTIYGWLPRGFREPRDTGGAMPAAETQ
jgi:hypothetical protein